MSESSLKKITAVDRVVPGDNISNYEFLLTDDEVVHLEYKAFRDIAVFTNKKIITMDVQGLTGKKKTWLIIPYNKCTAFSVESAGTFDLDSECKIWASGIGLIEIEFIRGTDIRELASVLAQYIG